MEISELISLYDLEEGTILIEPSSEYNSAIIGVSLDRKRLFYSYEKLISCLCEEMEYDDAVDYMEYNIIGTFECMNSEYAPIILNTIV